MNSHMDQEAAMKMSNEQAIQILKPFRDMMIDQNGCPISEAVFALDKALEALSAQPEIIRCKDCKWCAEPYDTDENAPYWFCKNWDGGTDVDGFCYEAERRADE